MKSMRTILFLMLSLIALRMGLPQSNSSDWFVLNPRMPYVYLIFNHSGKRVPAMNGESTQGLWLKLVNNCRVPVVIGTFDLGTKDIGIGVIHEVIPVTAAPISGGIDKDGKPTPKRQVRNVKPPEGYTFGVHSTKTLGPGESVLFSVPLEHISPDWFLRVKYAMDLPASRTTPISYVDFYWHNLPTDMQLQK